MPRIVFICGQKIMAEKPIIICTRGSALALAQSNMIAAMCRAAFPELHFELKIIKTTGDKLQKASMAKTDPSLPKGLFTKELEVALLKRPGRPGGSQPERFADRSARRPDSRRHAKARGRARCFDLSQRGQFDAARFQAASAARKIFRKARPLPPAARGGKCRCSPRGRI